MPKKPPKEFPNPKEIVEAFSKTISKEISKYIIIKEVCIRIACKIFNCIADDFPQKKIEKICIGISNGIPKYTAAWISIFQGAGFIKMANFLIINGIDKEV